MKPPDASRERIESLLPWYWNGTLGDDERAEVAAALREDAELRRELEETKAVGTMLETWPDTSTLVAHAADELAGAERDALEEYLEHDADARELVALARLGLATSEPARERPTARPATERRAPVADAAPARTPAALWPGLALAAGLVGAVALAGWLGARAELSRLRASEQVAAIGLASVATPVHVVELLPEELAARGGSSPAVRSAAGASRQQVLLTVVLVTQFPVGDYQRFTFELRDADGETLLREEIAPSSEGTFSVLLDRARIGGAQALVLLGERGGTTRQLHRYRLAP